jgi:D-cysteine desulfhydrase
MIVVGAAVTSALALRVTGYPPLPGWRGEVLARWEAEVVTAAAEALLDPEATPEEIGEVAARVDRYLATMPVEVQREVHGLIALVEHGTPLGLDLHRFTRLDRAAREAYLAGLAGKGGLLAQVYGGLRDLVMLGYYQQPATFASIGYEGPRQPLTYDPRGPERWRWPAYDAMVAPAGAVPRAAGR